MDAVSKGPLFSHFSETLKGVSIILAFQQQNEAVTTFYRRLDENSRLSFAARYCQGWFRLVLGMLSALLQIGIYYFIVAMKLYEGGDVSLYTVALTAVIMLSANLERLSFSFVVLENLMNSVERLKEYAELEDENVNTIFEPHASWPQKGVITFHDYSFRHREGLPLVLKKVNLTVNGGERIGIVGRTGSGKSSLMAGLYRLAEPAEGKITIDDVDISVIPVQSLRMKLAIIPQEPQLFIGTIRYNIDPFDQYTDDEIWKALKIAGLDTLVSALPLMLNEAVVESGANFSVGEKQLMCLTRALLRQSKILLLDEATASVDFDTDVLIQKALRQYFPGTTLLVIAHRLNTVMDMDRILVLDNGEVKEFDTVKKLITDTSSMFFSLVSSTGRDNANHLLNIVMHPGRLASASVGQWSVAVIPYI
jgi:ABC-type multidrug transport system fused ATPase/permease subunit